MPSLLDHIGFAQKPRRLRAQLEQSDVGTAYQWLSEYYSFLKGQGSDFDAATQLRHLFAEGVELEMVYTSTDLKNVRDIAQEMEESVLFSIARQALPFRLIRVCLLSGSVFTGFAAVTFGSWFLTVIALVQLLAGLVTEYCEVLHDCYNYACALEAFLAHDGGPLPPYMEDDFWGKQLLNATKNLQNREPWAVEVAIWLAIFSLSRRVNNG